jgi:hypothetical protein
LGLLLALSANVANAQMTAQNQEHFIEHGVAETVTSPVGNGWYDASGNDVADKCAWGPPPFLSGGYGYQYLWSNLTMSCVKTL